MSAGRACLAVDRKNRTRPQYLSSSAGCEFHWWPEEKVLISGFGSNGVDRALHVPENLFKEHTVKLLDERLHWSRLSRRYFREAYGPKLGSKTGEQYVAAAIGRRKAVDRKKQRLFSGGNGASAPREKYMTHDMAMKDAMELGILATDEVATKDHFQYELQYRVRDVTDLGEPKHVDDGNDVRAPGALVSFSRNASRLSSASLRLYYPNRYAAYFFHQPIASDVFRFASVFAALLVEM